MTPDEAIKSALEPVAGLANKVFPLEGLKNAAAPFVFYLQTAEDEEETLGGSTGLLSASFEVNAVARTYAELVALAGAVRANLRALQGTIYDGLLIERAIVRQTSPDLKEREVNLYRRAYVLQLHYQKEVTDHE